MAPRLELAHVALLPHPRWTKHEDRRLALATPSGVADAEDAAQQTFLSAYRAWERGERPRRAHNWLITIAHNVCRQRFRERSRRPAEVELDGRRRPAPRSTSGSRPRDLMTALGQLSSTSAQRSSCASSRAARTTRSPATLGVSHSAVETLLFRARRALREQLEGELTCGEAERACHADSTASSRAPRPLRSARTHAPARTAPRSSGACAPGAPPSVAWPSRCRRRSGRSAAARRRLRAGACSRRAPPSWPSGRSSPAPARTLSTAGRTRMLRRCPPCPRRR